MTETTIIKRNHLGGEVYRWKGKILERDAMHVLVEARFGLSGHGENVPADGVFLAEVQLFYGDRFVESYYSDRWWNSYEVHDREDDRIKCWYCNITYPAEFRAGEISFRDLALDLLVYPDGRQQVLDEDEFEALDLPKETREKALAALEELKRQFPG